MYVNIYYILCVSLEFILINLYSKQDVYKTKNTELEILTMLILNVQSENGKVINSHYK